MNIQNKTLLQFSDLSLSYGDKTLFNSISGSIVATDRIGLIGINGSGKSSLLKILAGLIKPDFGQVNKVGLIEYVPQIDLDLYKKDEPLYKHIENLYEEWWLVLSKYEELFESTLEENRIIKTLSGGELVKLNISIALVRNPDVLLLDEPTNHLDLNSLKKLVKLLKNIDIPFVIVSHNISFLNQIVNIIWEIDKEELLVYGGNYDFYKVEKDKMIKAQIDQYEVEKKKLKKEKLALQKANIQYAKKQAKLTRMARTNDRSLPKIVRNAIKLKVQTNYGVNKIKKEKNIEEVNQKVKELEIRKRKNLYLDLISEPKSGLIISISNGKLKLPNSTILVDEINLSLYHKDRLAILGNNGSGKTTFVKQLVYNHHPMLSGNIKYGSEYKVLYVDQKYDLVKVEQTITENIQSANPSINYENIRRVLGNMNFSSDFDINKTAKDLSGGETARLAFAIATNSSIDMLVLDEPTNNLDIETVEVISQALRYFKGTLIVISHDIHFIKSIRIEKVLEIKNRRIISKTINNLV